jgi:hypothetical protein
MLPFPAEVVFTDANWDRNETASVDAIAVNLGWQIAGGV